MRDKLTYIGGGAFPFNSQRDWSPRHETDFYPTEMEYIHAYLHIITDFPFLTRSTDRETWVWDTGAGDGRWGIAVKEKYPYVHLIGNDIRDLPRPDGYDVWISGPEGDMVNVASRINKYISKRPALIIGNPPYKIGDMWVWVALNALAPTGMVSFLFPSTFPHGSGRFETLYNNGFPISRIVHSNTRISFSGDGKTYPMREYSQIEWVRLGTRFDYRYLDSKDYVDFYRRSPIEHLTFNRKSSR